MRRQIMCLLMGSVALGACVSDAGDHPVVRDPSLPPVEAVTCDVSERLPVHGAAGVMTAATLPAVRAQLAAAGDEPGGCVGSALAFVDGTDLSRWDLWISKGYAAAEPAPAYADDGTTVTFQHGMVCGGAYPRTQLTVIRIPRGRVVQHRYPSGSCPRDVP